MDRGISHGNKESVQEPGWRFPKRDEEMGAEREGVHSEMTIGGVRRARTATKGGNRLGYTSAWLKKANVVSDHGRVTHRQEMEQEIYSRVKVGLSGPPGIIGKIG